MELHVQVLFRHDPDGRLRDVNEPPYEPAPRWFLGRTPEGSVVRYSPSVSDQERARLHDLVAVGFDLAKAVAVLAAGRPVAAIGMGPAYAFAEAVGPPAGRAVRIDHGNRRLLAPNFPYTLEQLNERQPCYAIVRGGAAVSVCCTARQTDRAAEASVATLAPSRGRGYARTVVRAWAAEVQGGGRLALYSTSWDNLASQAVARKLRLVPYGADVHIR